MARRRDTKPAGLVLKSNIMDAWSAGDLAEVTGVSLPTVRRASQRLALQPSRTDGGHRRFTARQARRLVLELGAVPRLDGFSRGQVQQLAALSQHPFGFTSLRTAAAAARLSTTASSAALAFLVDHALAQVDAEDVVDAGTAKPGHRWRLLVGPAWLAVADAVACTVLPAAPVAASPDRIPRRFWHHFWNADPAKLTVADDARFIAARLLLSHDTAAKGWALHNLPADAVEAATRNRAATPELKALVANTIAAS